MERGRAVEVFEVSKHFGNYQALDRVSFTIRENEFFTLLGPSGCGKTTLLRIIAGFETPTSGDVALMGEVIDALPAHKRRVNTVFQSYALFPHMTLAQNIAFGLENLGWEKTRRQRRVEEMLSLVHMEKFASRRPAQLSGGQRQRIALARALAPEPQVLLLDEPLSALDLKLRQAMRDELRSLQRKTGITFIFVTHDQEEALDMSDRICVMGDGRVQQIGTPDEVYEEPENAFVADFVGETNFMQCEVLSVDGSHARVRTPFGIELTAPQKGVVSKGSATMSLRPEKIGMENQAVGEALTGTVSARNYMGGYTHYTVETGGVSLRVFRRNAVSHAERYAIGQTVRIGFNGDSIRILGR
ncbi:ABC transporter ATP-binding protein [Martelella soudanensis]|uniref:ABC transporter ATP-binding protein n=1 Tax=unclassified Martelella TaxID=2629616 RepID=UPI0015DF791D|nr:MULTISPECIES: ABC transporter ATP-binding protein [unclassified Martelella]